MYIKTDRYDADFDNNRGDRRNNRDRGNHHGKGRYEGKSNYKNGENRVNGENRKDSRKSGYNKNGKQSYNRSREKANFEQDLSTLSFEERMKLYKEKYAGGEKTERASLFSALTGLRFSDVQALTWGKLEYLKDLGYYINFRQQKTGAVERMPVSKQAVELMGEPRGFNDVVFQNMNRFPHMRKMFRKWISDAGIEKHISFHCFRHSFATNQLTLGNAITTVSKLLGHRDLKTTMVYAKVVDSAKREAVDKLKLDIAPIILRKGGAI